MFIRVRLSGICSSRIDVLYILFLHCCNTVFRSPDLSVGYWLYCYLFYLRLICRLRSLSFSVFTLHRSLRFVFIDVPWICFIYITYLLRWLGVLGSLFQVYSCTVFSGLIYQCSNNVHIEGFS